MYFIDFTMDNHILRAIGSYSLILEIVPTLKKRFLYKDTYRMQASHN